MYQLVPTTMAEIAEKLAYLLTHDHDVTEAVVIQQAVLDNAQQMLDGDLEGPYWKVLWGKLDQTLLVQDIMKKEMGTVYPLTHSFTTDFRDNAPHLLQKMADQIQVIVNNS